MSGRATTAFLVEAFSDLIIVKLLGEFPDALYQLWRIAYLIRPGRRQRDGDIHTRPAVPADMQQGLANPMRLLDGDILNQQSQHPFAVLGLRGGSVPKTRKVLHQGQHLFLLFGGDYPGFPLLGFGILLFEIRQPLQGFIPSAFEGRRHQPVGGVDFLVTFFGQLGFILGALQAHLPLPHHRLVARFEVTQGLQGELDFRRLQHRQDALGDGSIQQIATDRHAGFGAEPFASEPVTFVSGIKPPIAAVAHRQAAAAAPAQEEALQERQPFTSRPTQNSRLAIGLIIRQDFLVTKKLFPGNVTKVSVFEKVENFIARI